jgi:hypothetical protein
MKTCNWYVAVKARKGLYHCDIIKTAAAPTAQNYPQYNFMFGGYSTRRKAEQVAMYQNYVIDTPSAVEHLLEKVE